MTRHHHRPNRWPERVLLSVGVLGFAWLLVYTGWLWRGDLLIYDALLWFGLRPAPKDIVIVAIDERSLMALGRWPWPRRLHAALIDRLTEADAKVIGIDLLFTEPDTLDPDGDRVLAQAVARNGRVVLPVAPAQLDGRGQLLELLPLPELAQAAAGLGHVEVELDRDGLARSVYLWAGLGSPHWSSLALAMLVVAGQPRTMATGPPTESERTPYTWVRRDWIRIPFIGPPGRFERLSYIDVLNGAVPHAALRNQFVLIGVTAAGLESMLPTPVSGLQQSMSGVEVQAHILAALRDDRAIYPLPLEGRWLLTSLCVLLPLLLYSRLPRRRAPLVLGLGLLSTLAASLLLLQVGRVWFGPMPALLALGIGYAVWTWRRWEEFLPAQEQRGWPMLHVFDDGVIMVGGDDRVRYLNPKAEQLTGCLWEQARGTALETLLQMAPPDTEKPITYLLARCRQQGHAVSLENSCSLRSRTGREYTVRLSATPLCDREGEGVLLMLRDVTREEEITQRLVHRANYDLLTNLPNRYLLQDRLTQALTRARRTGRQVAVLFIDLDRFKAINDQLGHAAGDALLVEMAVRLQACVRKQDTVTRLGGDEFIVVLEDVVEPGAVVQIADKLLKELQKPATVAGETVSVSASIGISVFSGDESNEPDLLACADAAMYAAKKGGGDTARFYDDGMQGSGFEPASVGEAGAGAVDGTAAPTSNARSDARMPLPAERPRSR